MSDNLEIIHVTFPSEELAKKLAGDLVKMKLAACCQIIPNVTSIYSWESKICEDAEVLMIVKAVSSKRNQIESYILKHHQYDIPEFIVTEISYVSNKYLAWAKNLN